VGLNKCGDEVQCAKKTPWKTRQHERPTQNTETKSRQEMLHEPEKKGTFKRAHLTRTPIPKIVAIHSGKSLRKDGVGNMEKGNWGFEGRSRSSKQKRGRKETGNHQKGNKSLFSRGPP